MTIHIYVDADACPVKDEAVRVATRYSLSLTFVSNQRMRPIVAPNVEQVVVASGFDAADDWIVERALSGDLVVTTDILLAGRCVERGASVISPTGRLFDEENIGDAVATRNLLAELRGAGEITGGPAPLEKRDRSRFLQKFDEVIQKLRRQRPSGPPAAPPPAPATPPVPVDESG